MLRVALYTHEFAAFGWMPFRVSAWFLYVLYGYDVFVWLCDNRKG